MSVMVLFSQGALGPTMELHLLPGGQDSLTSQVGSGFGKQSGQPGQVTISAFRTLR